MARFFYFYKSGQIVLSILCIIFLSSVNELCRTEQVSIVKNLVKRDAPPFEVKSSLPNTTLDTLLDAIFDNSNETEILRSLNETLIAAKIDDDVLMDTKLDNLMDVKLVDTPVKTIDDTQLLIDASKNAPLPSQLFIHDSRTQMYTTYCVSIPFFNANIVDALNGKNTLTPEGTYPIYAQKLSSRYIPIALLFTFAVYCLIRMLCLFAKPYSHSDSRRLQLCQCSNCFHGFFSLIILGAGLFSLLYAHHYWNNIRDWPHIDAMVDFPVFWLFAEVLFLIIILSVAVEMGLRDGLYALIKLDRSQYGYRLPPFQADASILSANASANPLQPRNYFDAAQQEPNEMEMTISDIAKLHRCYGSRRSAGVAPPAPKPTFIQPSSDQGANESSSSSNCASSTFRTSPANAV